ncbi:MAG: NAD(P)H-dependent oxidoreductase [Pseudomonadota bacterium]
MDKSILRVDASMRRDGSQSRLLTDHLLELLGGSGEPNVVRRDLADGVPFVDDAWIDANTTDPAQRSDAQREALAHSDVLVSELKAADVLVAAVPIYNFGVPAAFKAWIDMVARARETFRYTPDGPQGLLEGKKAYLVITSGGTRLGSEIDFVSPWLRHVMGFLGIHDVEIIDASGLMMDAEARIAAAINRMDELPLAA